jgi:hypothetical protein
MSTNFKIENNTYLKDSGSSLAGFDSSLIRVLLAESILSEVALIRVGVIDMPQVVMTTVHCYEQLLESIASDQPQLVLLGNIDVVNYFAISQECNKIAIGLPIILLSKQEIINDSFREAIKSYGMADIVCSSDFAKISQIILNLDSVQPQIAGSSLPSMITGKIMLANLEEIVIISNNYFGPLAQGNYWRKSHTSLVDKFPLLQKWSADHFGKLTCDTDILDLKLTGQDIQCLQRWVGLFIEECERIIVGYGEILGKSNLSPAAQELLAKSP